MSPDSIHSFICLPLDGSFVCSFVLEAEIAGHRFSTAGRAGTSNLCVNGQLYMHAYCRNVGKYMEVNVYPAYEQIKGKRKKVKQTSEVQKALNDHNRKKKLTRQILKSRH